MESHPYASPQEEPDPEEFTQQYPIPSHMAEPADDEPPAKTKRKRQSARKTTSTPSAMPTTIDIASADGLPVAIVLDEGRFKNQSQRDALQEIIAEFKSRPDGTPLVIHFHGGLVTEANALEKATESLAPLYRDDAGGVPLAVVWRTGFWTSIGDTLPKIFSEMLFSRVLDKVLDKVRFGGATLAIEDDTNRLVALFAELSFEDEEQFAIEVADDEVLDKVAREIRNEFGGASLAASSGSSIVTLADASVIQEIRGNVPIRQPSGAQTAGLRAALSIGWRAAKALMAVGRRFASKRDHGLHATVVEEVLRQFYLGSVGQDVWGTMKRYTDDAFAGPPDSHGGSAIVEAIGNLLAEGRRPRIVLVGHSAGSIFISKFLEVAAEQFARFSQNIDTAFRFEVVFLAPAIRYDRFASTLERAEHMIGRFRMFTMLDEFESKDALINVSGLSWVYPSSLLYFISGILEPDEVDIPLLGLHRHFERTGVYDARRFPHVQRVRDWLVRQSGRLVWSKTTHQIPGLQCTAVDHGGFTEDPATRSSLQHLLTSTDVFAGIATATATVGPREHNRIVDSLIDSREFTGRYLVRVSRDDWRSAQRTFRNEIGVASFERPDLSASIDQIVDGGAAAFLPSLGVAVVSMTEDQYASELSAKLSTTSSSGDGSRTLVRERFAYLAHADRPPLPPYLDGFERGVRATLDAVRESAPHEGYRREGSSSREPAVARSAPPERNVDSSWSEALNMLGISRARTRGLTGRGVRVCVIDTGLDLSHPDFLPQQFGSRSIQHVSFVGDTAQDLHGHGTHCAGLAVGTDSPLGGVRYGVACLADLLVARVFDKYTRATEGNVLLALDWAIEQRADIVSMSLVFPNGTPENDQLFTEAIELVVAAKVLVLAASGNSSARSVANAFAGNPTMRPAVYPGVVAVGSVGYSDSAGSIPIARFSNGTAASPVALVAPGVNVYSAWPRPLLTRGESGTSMATPLAAGVAALIAEDTGFRGTLLRDELIRRANALPHLPVGAAGAGLVSPF